MVNVTLNIPDTEENRAELNARFHLIIEYIENEETKANKVKTGIDIYSLDNLDKEGIFLGRGSEYNNINIGDQDSQFYNLISGRQARFVWSKADRTFIIHDGHTEKPSTNGFYFRDESQKIGGEGNRRTKKTLKHNDWIEFRKKGEVLVRVYYRDSAIVAQRFTAKSLPTSEGTVLKIGQDNHGDYVTIDDVLVDKLHAQIEYVAGKHILKDKNSANDTILLRKNTEYRLQRQSKLDVHDSEKYIPLQNGDFIKIGTLKLLYDGTMLLLAVQNYDRITLKAENIKRVASEVLLSNISLVAEPGELVALVGGSGAGKSTLLKVLLGKDVPEEGGSVRFNDQDLNKVFNEYREKIGYVPQDDIVHATLKVEQVLKYSARLRLPEKSLSDINKDIDFVLEKLDLPPDKYRKRRVNTLSGGQRKRVNIAVELVANPPILFLDEPTASLDPDLRQVFMTELKKLTNQDKTVIIVTHSPDNVNNFCNLVAFLARDEDTTDGGQLVYYGKPTEISNWFKAVHDKANHKAGLDPLTQLYKVVKGNVSELRDNLLTISPYEKYVEKRLPPQDKKGKTVTFTDQGSKPRGIERSLAKEALRQWHILTERYFISMLSIRNLISLIFPFVAAPLLMYFFIDTNLFKDLPSQDFFGLQDALIVIFVMTIFATFSVLNAVEEIAKEQTIYQRERLVILSIRAYLFSKVFVLLSFGVVQALIFISILHGKAGFPFDDLTDIFRFLGIIITVSLIMLPSQAVGLFLSSQLRGGIAIKVTILFLIYQVLATGIIFPLEGASEYISWFTFTRWGSEALGALVNYPDSPHPFVDRLEVHSSIWFALFKSWWILVTYTILAWLATIFALKRQDPR